MTGIIVKSLSCENTISESHIISGKGKSSFSHFLFLSVLPPSLIAIDHPAWYFDRKIIITVVCCVFILPLCIPEKLKVVSYSR